MSSGLHSLQIQKVCELVHVEVEAGDCLFFHCNLLHCSAANWSELRRYAFVVAYNAASNNPVYEHDHAQYTTPMDIVSVIDHTTFKFIFEFKISSFLFDVH